MSGSLGELLDVNPSESAEALADAFSSYVETCVSETLRSMQLPPARIPPPTEARLRTLTTKRRKKADRLKLQTISTHESFVRELYYLRSQLRGDPEYGTTPRPMEPDGDLRTTREEAGASPPATDISYGEQILDGDGLTSQRLDLSPSFLPYTTHLRPLDELSIVRISLKRQVQDLIMCDPVFERVVKTVESSLRTLVLESKVPMEFDFAIKSDPEYPHWKRYIITVNTCLDFDAKMACWSEIDAHVRERLRQLRDSRQEDSVRIDDIGTNLFIHMEL